MRRKQRPAGLSQRHGLDPARLRMPEDGRWATLRDHLVDRLPVPAERVDLMLAEGRVHDLTGPVAPNAPFVPGGAVWFHRDLPVEVPVPFEISVVHRDDAILVVDKPHFLATIPRGKHVVETALVRLRRDLDLPALSPAHRLDRVTAGLVMFVVDPALRGRYQTMFADRLVRKEYEAIAPVRDDLELPRVVRSRIVKEKGVITAQEVPGPVNAETRVELAERRGDLGRYRLLPTTGRTHQLRVHLSGLGVPIVGDDFYPVLREKPLDDFTDPLQLLAKVLEFTDPVTGEHRRFTSSLALGAWS
ncbi:RluA family pseudouridine synthase [Actinosynnema pretiosum subsp. pretiosum]|uniref:RNA pseudouridylate synthase n=2 Tax=Actinosynnema TaxID=40566 RepID=C6W980_ACTMD|nr:RluA family pseudouridine synthase [Actinosynnema mirum]ACU39152.1 pseudouridine synthase [Actinosynnema mirum DSM 43827]AXX32751.1 Ribosomal large subunit pseudouridine synthase A [Actinosynnema pretiosum subsp. pretiosum]QUF03372.1 RluA family pseudouridine synthase [Actinosynnema pretiosum subsp. pretiosum]